MLQSLLCFVHMTGRGWNLSGAIFHARLEHHMTCPDSQGQQGGLLLLYNCLAVASTAREHLRVAVPLCGIVISMLRGPCLPSLIETTQVC